MSNVTFLDEVPPTANAELLHEVAQITIKSASENEITLEKFVIFGSQVTGYTHELSDIDMLLVAPEWEGVPYLKRGFKLAMDYPYLDLPSPDYKALTPHEFQLKLDKRDNPMINNALEAGVEVELHD